MSAAAVINLGTISTTNASMTGQQPFVQGGTVTIGNGGTLTLAGAGALTNFGTINLLGGGCGQQRRVEP